MGGKRKTLTNTRRAALKKEMTEALIAGTFTTNGRPVDEVLDEIKTGIEEGRYPIEVDLQTLIGIWTGSPAPTEAPAPEPQPTNHGTVDQIQQAQAAAQQNGQPQQWTSQGGYEITGQTGVTAESMPLLGQAQPVTPAEQAATQYPAVQQPSQLAQAIGVAPGQMIPTAVGQMPVLQPDNGAGYAIPERYPVPQQHSAQPMTVQQAQAAMTAAENIEVGQPPKEEAVRVDAAPVADWIGLARQAEAKIKALKDILEQAKANASAYADQIGGPDRSKVLLLDGQVAMRRTYVVKNNFSKDRLAEAHPEIDVTAFTERSTYYRTELV